MARIPVSNEWVMRLNNDIRIFRFLSIITERIPLASFFFCLKNYEFLLGQIVKCETFVAASESQREKSAPLRRSTSLTK